MNEKAKLALQMTATLTAGVISKHGVEDGEGDVDYKRTGLLMTGILREVLGVMDKYNDRAVSVLGRRAGEFLID